LGDRLGLIQSVPFVSSVLLRRIGDDLMPVPRAEIMVSPAVAADIGFDGGATAGASACRVALAIAGLRLSFSCFCLQTKRPMPTTTRASVTFS
jgi:hypothetical protein